MSSNTKTFTEKITNIQIGKSLINFLSYDAEVSVGICQYWGAHIKEELVDYEVLVMRVDGKQLSIEEKNIFLDCLNPDELEQLQLELFDNIKI